MNTYFTVRNDYTTFFFTIYSRTVENSEFGCCQWLTSSQCRPAFGFWSPVGCSKLAFFTSLCEMYSNPVKTFRGRTRCRGSLRVWGLRTLCRGRCFWSSVGEGQDPSGLGPAPPSALGLARDSWLRSPAEGSREVPAASSLRTGSEQEGKNQLKPRNGDRPLDHLFLNRQRWLSNKGGRCFVL